MAVACYHGYLVCIVDCEVGVYEDEDVRYRFREGQSWGEECPGMRVRIEDNYQEGRRRTCILVRTERALYRICRERPSTAAS